MLALASSVGRRVEVCVSIPLAMVVSMIRLSFWIAGLSSPKRLEA